MALPAYEHGSLFKKYKMKMHSVTARIFFVLFTVGIVACDSGPKVIQPSSESAAENGHSDNFAKNPHNHSATTPSNNMHTVTVEEVLPTDKYVYLHVKEGEEKYWIAALKADVQVGESYMYSGGLLQTNFESKEYDRVFEKVILVSSLVKASGVSDQPPVVRQEKKEKVKPDLSESIEPAEGSIKISELVENAKKYEGKIIQLTGTCTKINRNIMNRNWIHLKDGSKDDFDLVITSSQMVSEGAVVTLKGKVVLNKDFGAGYTYDLILEEGMVVE